jgi:hypothetical protein
LLTFFNGRSVDEQRPKEGEKETDSPERYIVPPGTQTETPENRPQRRRRQAAPKADEVAVPKFSRRAAFADAVTKDNPLLARAMVNRVWAMLFGRGLVHPVDLMDSKHPASHPELLDWLARDFERNGYDVKRLIRTLCSTKAYQLDSRAARGKAKSPAPETFARTLDKPLTAEQLFRTLVVATGNQPDKDGKIAGVSERDLRYAFIAQFPDLFPAEYNATLSQAMFLSNSPLFDQLLTPRADNLAARLTAEKDAEARVRHAFELVFAREPDREELRECITYLAWPFVGGRRKATALGDVEQRGIPVEPLMSDRFSHLPNPACGGADHTLHRRKFLQGVVSAGAFSLMSWGGLFSLPAFAQKAKREQKHCILLWLCGAPSQFETWDPKPGRPTGGPFRSIPRNFLASTLAS